MPNKPVDTDTSEQNDPSSFKTLIDLLNSFSKSKEEDQAIDRRINKLFVFNKKQGNHP